MAYDILGSWALNEGAGNSVNPTAGTAAGTGTGLVWTTFSDSSPALDRTVGNDGAQRVSILSGLPASAVTAAGTFWAMAWVRPLADGGSARFPLVFYSTVSGLNLDDDWAGLEIAADGTSRWYVGATLPAFSTATVANGTWAHFACTYDGTTLRTYIDGALANEDAVAGLATLGGIHINGAQWGARGGAMRDVRFGTGVPTVGEIGTLRNTRVENDVEPEPEEPTPLDTPVVTITAENDPTAPSASDGEVTVSWPSVPNAASYDAMIANSATPSQGDFTLHEAGVTSPYTFESQGAGTRAYGIIARAE